MMLLLQHAYIRGGVVVLRERGRRAGDATREEHQSQQRQRGSEQESSRRWSRRGRMEEKTYVC